MQGATMEERNQPVTRLEILRERHQKLDDIVDEMSSREVLTPADMDQLKTLKIRRLRVKDAIRDLTRDSYLMPKNFEVK